MPDTQSCTEKGYLDVINKTIEALRRDFEKKGLEDGIQYLEGMKNHWLAGLYDMTEFTEDPKSKPTAPHSGKKVGKNYVVVPVGAGLRRKHREKSNIQDSVVSIFLGPSSRDLLFDETPASRESEASPARKRGREDGRPDPLVSPAKRARVRKGKGEEPPAAVAKENLSSSDDGDPDMLNAAAEDKTEEFENYVLSDYHRVRSSIRDAKFKATLNEGMACVNGRDYLFKRAFCTFDW